MSDESVVNMASKCANKYYCTYCEKCVSLNKKLHWKPQQQQTSSKITKKYTSTQMFLHR
jgi:hypothetical protein